VHELLTGWPGRFVPSKLSSGKSVALHLPESLESAGERRRAERKRASGGFERILIQ
jgi:hypothetical protein